VTRDSSASFNIPVIVLPPDSSEKAARKVMPLNERKSGAYERMAVSHGYTTLDPEQNTCVPSNKGKVGTLSE
jgi:hypothetical protein